MTPMNPERPSLRRSRDQRLLFGVCGGLATYFNIDPTLVRVGFVVVGLLPPMGGMLLLAYIAMAVIVPEEGADEMAGREQVKENLSSLKSELFSLGETVRAKITGEPKVTVPKTPVTPVTPMTPPPAAAVGETVADSTEPVHAKAA